MRTQRGWKLHWQSAFVHCLFLSSFSRLGAALKASIFENRSKLANTTIHPNIVTTRHRESGHFTKGFPHRNSIFSLRQSPLWLEIGVGTSNTSDESRWGAYISSNAHKINNFQCVNWRQKQRGEGGVTAALAIQATCCNNCLRDPTPYPLIRISFNLISRHWRRVPFLNHDKPGMNDDSSRGSLHSLFDSLKSG